MTNLTDLSFTENYFTKDELAKLKLTNLDDTAMANYLNHIVAEKIAVIVKEKDHFYSKKLALQELEEDTFYNNSPCGYFSTAANGIINKINDTLLAWLGYIKEDIVGKVTWQSLLSVGGKMYFETHYSPLLQMQGFVQEISFEMVKKDKNRLPVLINTKQIRDEHGKVQINYSTVFDVSQRKSYEKELLIAKRIAEEQTKLLNETNEELRSSEEEIRQNLEELVAIQEQLQGQYDLLAIKNKNIADSINYAKRIQTALLPRLAEIRDFFPDSFVLFRPRDVISGDFYWFANKGNFQIIVTADCTGHGVPGAFMSMLGSSLLNQIIHDKEISKPNEILDLLHSGVEEMLNQRHEDNTNRDGMDASICIINRKKNIVKFAGANNPMYVLSQKPLNFITENSTENIRIEQAENWQLTEIKADKKPIGGRVIKQNDLNYTLHLFELDQEMRIYLFSDGFVDQIGGEGRKKLMSKGFKKLIIDNHQIPFNEQGVVLENFFENWIYETKRQLDDVMLLGIKIEQ